MPSKTIDSEDLEQDMAVQRTGSDRHQAAEPETVKIKDQITEKPKPEPEPKPKPEPQPTPPSKPSGILRHR